MNSLEQKYQNILDSQKFDESYLDYTLLEKHKVLLRQLAGMSNSGITVFDMYQQQHVFTSYNFAELFGYDLDAIEIEGNKYFDDRVHPDDMQTILYIGTELMTHYAGRREDIANYKLINEYRILNAQNQYVRIIEQHQVLEFDNQGKIWLSLSVLDLSPDQTAFNGVKSKMLNKKTGEYYSVLDQKSNKHTQLSSREKQVLQLIREGLLSKEISEQLFISVHTVNTHRQRILEKLNVNNSMEAVHYASSLGLLS